MDDKSLYQQLLGLTEPWFVQRVDVDFDAERVDVFVEHRADTGWQCPHCGKACPLYDHRDSRAWRHLDTCQLQTFLHARPPRVECDEHGVCNVRLPWAEPGSHFTMLMERMVINLLLHCRNVKSAAALARIKWGQCAGVMHRAVHRGLRRRGRPLTPRLSVDEKQYARGHTYATIVTDADRGVVLDVIDGHKTEDLALFYRRLTQEQREAIQVVATDALRAYLRATADELPDGDNKIVLDRFHIMKQANQALERVRLAEHRELRLEGNTTLQRSKQMLLWADENRPSKYDDRMKALQAQDLRTGKAWSMKENLRRLWDCPTAQEARAFFGKWFNWVTSSAIKPMAYLARMLKAKLSKIVRFCEHRLTTAGSEGINSQISSAQHRAAGYRNFHRLRVAILFFCGGLRLHPS